MAEILLIDDMLAVRQALATPLQLAHHHVTAADSGMMALAYLRTKDFDLVITDILMPDIDGLDVLNFIATMSKRIPVIAISGGGSSMSAHHALLIAKTRANAVLPKPVENAALLTLVHRLLEESQVA